MMRPYFLIFALIFLSGCAAEAPAAAAPAVTASPAPPQPTATSFRPLPVFVPNQMAADTACAETEGILQAGSIETSLLDKPMRYQVYLPPCYAAQPQKHYPALYLLHGQNFDETQWLQIGLAEKMDELTAAGKISPFVVILPFDYSYKQPAQYRFEEVFLSLLMPKIEADYRLQPGRAATAIGGLSRGGAWSLYLGSRHPDLFAIIGAHSPALFYSDLGAFPLRLRDLPQDQKPTLYLDAGNNDPDLTTIHEIVALLDSYNLNYEWHANLGFHDGTYWSAHLTEYLLWYGARFSEIP